MAPIAARPRERPEGSFRPRRTSYRAALPISINTARGRYLVGVATPLDNAGDAILLTLALERADGVERVALRCRIATGLAGAAQADVLAARLAGWIERDFESIRETALKTIRAERRLHEFTFDAEHPGPF